MKKLLNAAIALFLCYNIQAQITITKSDFASAGDKIFVSIASPISVVDYTFTGSGITWDYSALSWQSQKEEEYLNVSTTANIYALYFADLSFNSNRANVATKGQNFSNNFSLVPITFSNVYNFFYKSNTQYVQKGIGAEVAGITTPVSYGGDDIIYRFPLQYGNMDTSNSDYALAVLGIGAYVHRQTRQNQVDGYGTLITPFGSFETVRVVSVIDNTDSVYVDTLSLGYAQKQPLQREYKWLGNGYKAPLLQVNTREVFGTELITDIIYQDSVRNLPTAITDNILLTSTITISPNPTKDQFTIYNAGINTNVFYAMYNLQGQLVSSGQVNNRLVIDVQNWPRGLYSIYLGDGVNKKVTKMMVD